jgi:putative ABC transport system permease protein
MKLFLVALLRQLAEHPLATLSVVFGVTLALASVVAVHLLAERIATELERTYPASFAGLTHAARAPRLQEDDYFELRRRWRAGLLQVEPRGVDITSMTPMVEGEIGDGRQRYEVFAFDPIAVPAALGIAIAAPSLLLEDSVLAHHSTGLVPEQVLVLGPGAVAVRIVGTFGEAGGPVDASAVAAVAARGWLLADLATGQRLLADPTAAAAAERSIDGVAFGLALPLPSWLRWLDALFPGLATQVRATERVLAIDGYDVLALGDAAERRFADAILFNLGALSMLAAVVAGFLIYQSGVNAIRQRALLLSRLDAMGVPAPVVRLHFAAEGLAFGLAGVVLGLPIGWLLSSGLGALAGGGMADSGAAAAGATLLSGPLLAKVVGFGAGAGVAGMLLAERAVRRPARVSTLPLGGLLAGTIAVAVGIGLPATGSAGGFLAIAGLCVVATSVLPTLLRGGSGALSRGWKRGGLVSVLNLRELRATMPDVQAAGAALLIAVAAAIGIGLMVGSLRYGFESMVDQRLTADVVLESLDGFTSADIARLRSQPQVAEARAYRQARGVIRGHGAIELQIAVLDDAELARYGTQGPYLPGSVYLSEPAARSFGLATRSAIRIEGDAGAMDATVAAIFRDYGSPRPRVLVDARDAQALVSDPLPRRVSLQLVSAGGIAAVQQLALERGWRMQTLAELRDLARRTFERTFHVTDALAAVALTVATAGLYNALSSLALKRRAEMRLLHGLGIDPRTVVRMGLAQALLLGALLVLAAIPLGIGIAWVLCAVVNPRAFGWSIPFVPSLRPIAFPVVLGIAAAGLAGAFPALRSARRAAAVDRD